MKAVILAGGKGTRISEETSIRPKPMVEIGGRPILWHIMKTYSHYGINDFIICAGYMQYFIKEYFSNYFLHSSDVTFDMAKNEMHVHHQRSEPWKVTIVDTGEETMTGGRLLRVRDYIEANETFCFTYGDGLGQINVAELIAFHREKGRYATLTCVQPPGRFGALQFADETIVASFQEKPRGDGSWVNGGYFVLEPKVFEYLKDDATIWEREPLEKLAAEEQLSAYRHQGFWHAMDTLRDKTHLEGLWQKGAPWKVWS
ncbi:glucose-1-phosphate cytidylyltransferase [Cerasicoccus maritimus]|uniref:glucose-1-phosphate cytidylyltransferase n=1 Tax=Cerasicoccus maritimus TaxID=490089 RepID=UPI00285287E5|nr:glucose-1-phosphate cytidylyltransferase [Cerasicoccus maritimus]